MKASIEQRKTRRQDARLGLNVSVKHPSDAEITQVIDRLHRRQVTVLDKQPVCGDETYVVGGWMPVQLALERDFRFDVALHRVGRDDESFTNLTVRQAAGNQHRDLELARCEWPVRSARGMLDRRVLQR